MIHRWAAVLLALVLICATSSASAAECSADGPYVTLAEGGGWLASSVASDCTLVRDRVRNRRVHIAPLDGIPAFEVALRAPPRPAASSAPLGPSAPLLVIARLRWAFGRGQLVVTGDMLDRGPRQLEILWLLYELEGEAAKAGGRVHVLIGNHEGMTLRGDLRYLNPRYEASTKALGLTSYSETLAPDTVLGAWLRSRPAVLKLGSLLLLHGGVSPALAASPLTLDQINALVRRNLDVAASTKFAEGSDDALVMGNDGPLWYRGYFALDDKPAAASADAVSNVKRRFGVSRLLVGHTIVERVSPLYGGDVVAVQVYPHLDKATGAPILEGALRLRGVWYRATAQGERLPLDLEN
jgi:hypothetical protein